MRCVWATPVENIFLQRNEIGNIKGSNAAPNNSARQTVTVLTSSCPPAVVTPSVTPEHLHQYDTQGFFVLDRVIPPAHLELLRRLSDEAVATRALGDRVGYAEGDQLMDTLGGRYFIFGLEEERPEIYKVLFGDWAVTIIRALTDESTMFHTEFVVKEGGRGDARTRFGWHQDGGYNAAPGAGGAGVPRTPHISIWCALDDMSAANGGACSRSNATQWIIP